MVRSGGGGVILVRSFAVLFSEFTSPPPDIVAVFVTNGEALLATFTVSVIAGYDALEASTSLRVQVTVEPGLGQLQPVPVTALKVSPAGSVSLTVTVVPSVDERPTFFTVRAYVPV